MNEADARKYAKDIGAIFRATSACTAAGIEELFKSIGCKVLNPNYKDDEESPSPSPKIDIEQKKEEPKEKDDKKIKLNNKKPEKEKKKGCC